MDVTEERSYSMDMAVIPSTTALGALLNLHAQLLMAGHEEIAIKLRVIVDREVSTECCPVATSDFLFAVAVLKNEFPQWEATIHEMAVQS